jgi:hypothetical protein
MSRAVTNISRHRSWHGHIGMNSVQHMLADVLHRQEAKDQSSHEPMRKPWLQHERLWRHGGAM